MRVDMGERPDLEHEPRDAACTCRGSLLVNQIE
jgi:hypothetical protein